MILERFIYKRFILFHRINHVFILEKFLIINLNLLHWSLFLFNVHRIQLVQQHFHLVNVQQRFDEIQPNQHEQIFIQNKSHCFTSVNRHYFFPIVHFKVMEQRIKCDRMRIFLFVSNSKHQSIVHVTRVINVHRFVEIINVNVDREQCHWNFNVTNNFVSIWQQIVHSIDNVVYIRRKSMKKIRF